MFTAPFWLLHRSNPSVRRASPASALPEGAITWTTCIRQILLGFVEPPPEPETGEQLLRDGQAYQFLLEVICGLHSPVVGETEILGQFKILMKSVLETCPPFWRPLFTALLEDAKHIREKFLVGQGAQSYGSLVRSSLRSAGSVYLLGSGQLAGEMLPWLVKDQRQVTIVSRNSDTGARLAAEFGVTWQPWPLAQVAPGAAWVVAAPIPATELHSILRSASQVLDLRGDSAQDVLEHPHLVDLQTLFSEVSRRRTELQELRTRVLDVAKDVVQQRTLRPWIRPFGWDDLCA